MEFTQNPNQSDLLNDLFTKEVAKKSFIIITSFWKKVSILQNKYFNLKNCAIDVLPINFFSGLVI